MSEELSESATRSHARSPSRPLAAAAERHGRGLRRGRRRPPGVLGQTGRAADLGPEVDRRLDWWDRPFSKVVRRRQAERRRQLRRPPRRRRATATRSRYYWEGEPGDTRDHHVRRAEEPGLPGRATRSSSSASKAGDRVAIYMPMIPETVVAMLACARIGAPHTVVFGGFSSTRAVRPHPRLRRAASSSPPTAATAAAPPSALKPAVDEALREVPGRAQRTLVVRRTGQDVDVERRGATCGGTTRSDRQSTRPHRRGLRRRAPAVRHVHLRHDGQAQGHPAHDRRLPDPGVLHAPRGLRPQARRPTSTGAARTSAG